MSHKVIMCCHCWFIFRVLRGLYTYRIIQVKERLLNIDVYSREIYCVYWLVRFIIVSHFLLVFGGGLQVLRLLSFQNTRGLVVIISRMYSSLMLSILQLLLWALLNIIMGSKVKCNLLRWFQLGFVGTYCVACASWFIPVLFKTV